MGRSITQGRASEIRIVWRPWGYVILIDTKCDLLFCRWKRIEMRTSRANFTLRTPSFSSRDEAKTFLDMHLGKAIDRLWYI